VPEEKKLALFYLSARIISAAAFWKEEVQRRSWFDGR
jgi:hypothetical protein